MYSRYAMKAKTGQTDASDESGIPSHMSKMAGETLFFPKRALCKNSSSWQQGKKFRIHWTPRFFRKMYWVRSLSRVTPRMNAKSEKSFYLNFLSKSLTSFLERLTSRSMMAASVQITDHGSRDLGGKFRTRLINKRGPPFF